MKNDTVLYIGLGVLALVLIPGIVKGSTGSFDLSFLNGSYDADDVQRLQNLSDELFRRGLSPLQVKLLLAQALHETGLFTANPNYNAIDTKKNYAGISQNGQIRTYNSIADFVTDWLRVLNLTRNGNLYPPIDAVNVDDFNTRLKANGYYTDSIIIYGNALNRYFNLLN